MKKNDLVERWTREAKELEELASQRLNDRNAIGAVSAKAEAEQLKYCAAQLDINDFEDKKIPSAKELLRKAIIAHAKGFEIDQKVELLEDTGIMMTENYFILESGTKGRIMKILSHGDGYKVRFTIANYFSFVTDIGTKDLGMVE